MEEDPVLACVTAYMCACVCVCACGCACVCVCWHPTRDAAAPPAPHHVSSGDYTHARRPSPRVPGRWMGAALIASGSLPPRTLSFVVSMQFQGDTRAHARPATGSPRKQLHAPGDRGFTDLRCEKLSSLTQWVCRLMILEAATVWTH